MNMLRERLRKTSSPPSNGRPAQGSSPLRERLSARVGYRTRTLGLGIALALTAGLLTLVYVNRAEQRATLSAANVEVFVAAADIPQGTTGSALVARGLLERQRVPRRAVVSGAISDPQQIEQLVVGERIYAGEQITTRRFRTLSERGIRGDLSGTRRAIVVQGEPTQLLAGILRSGDRVDVLATVALDNGRGQQIPAARVILRDLLVIDAGRAGGAAGAAGAERATATVVLAVTDAQAQKLFFAMKHGQWSLLLRPFGRSADSSVGVDTAETLLESTGG